MKTRLTLVLLSCIVVSLWEASIPARAVQIDPGDSISISMSNLPSQTYVAFDLELAFNSVPSATSFHLEILDPGNVLVVDAGLVSLPAFTSQANIGFTGVPGVGNTDHYFIDQITSVFDLASAKVDGATALSPDVVDTGFITQQFTVSVPGPIAGAGLPGLIFAVGSLLAWCSRKCKTLAA
jgi:hypothetical protein